MRDLYMMIVIVSMSGCTAVETSTQLYQLCKYQDKCPVEVVGNWLKGGQIMEIIAFLVIGNILLSGLNIL